MSVRVAANHACVPESGGQRTARPTGCWVPIRFSCGRSKACVALFPVRAETLHKQAAALPEQVALCSEALWRCSEVERACKPVRQGCKPPKGRFSASLWRFRRGFPCVPQARHSLPLLTELHPIAQQELERCRPCGTFGAKRGGARVSRALISPVKHREGKGGRLLEMPHVQTCPACIVP